MANIDEVLSGNDISADGTFLLGSVSIAVRFKEVTDSGMYRVSFQRKPSGAGTAGIAEWAEIASFNPSSLKDVILEVVDTSATYRFVLDTNTTGEVRVTATGS